MLNIWKIHTLRGFRFGALMGKRLCIFCGSPGKLTSSHVIGKALLKSLPRNSDWFKYDETSSDPNHEPIHRVTNTDPRETKPNSLCSQCNNQWMEKHESVVRELLVKLALGQHTVITDKDQYRLATWTLIASIVRASVAEHDHIDPHEIKTLRENDSIPDGYQFWIFQGEDRLDWPSRFQHGEDDAGNKFWFAWLWIGQVVFVVASPFITGRIDDIFEAIPAHHLRPMPGSESIVWPMHAWVSLRHSDFKRLTTLKVS